MPQLTGNEFDEIMSEYAAVAKPLTGEQLYEETDAQIYEGKSFGCLPPGEQDKFNLIADTFEEVYAEHREQNR